jgi:hypothetical protein
LIDIWIGDKFQTGFLGGIEVFRITAWVTNVAKAGIRRRLPPPLLLGYLLAANEHQKQIRKTG